MDKWVLFGWNRVNTYILIKKPVSRWVSDIYILLIINLCGPHVLDTNNLKCGYYDDNWLNVKLELDY